METSEIRSRVKAAATGIPHAKIWPNGLGFDHRGVQYVLVPEGGRYQTWCASKAYGDHASRSGYGNTPAAAKAAAGIGRVDHAR